MKDLTVVEAAAELGVHRNSIFHWATVSCRPLGGRRLRLSKQKRLFKNARAGWAEREVLVVPGELVARLKQGLTEQATPSWLIWHHDALQRFPWLTEEKLYNWRKARPSHPSTKAAAASTTMARRRGTYCPLGRPLTVEHHPVVTGHGVRSSVHYRLDELREIEKLLTEEVGRIVEGGVEYKTAGRIQSDYQLRKNCITQLFHCLPSGDRPTPIIRNVLIRTSNGRLFHKRQRLWPDAKVRQALEVHAQPTSASIDHNGATYVTIKEAARRSGFSDARIRAWCSSPCRLIGRKLDLVRKPITGHGFRKKRAALYVLLADIELIAAKRHAALKAGWRLYGPLPDNVTAAIDNAEMVASDNAAGDGKGVSNPGQPAPPPVKSAPTFISANEDRDRWIYDQRMNLLPWKTIQTQILRLAPLRQWERLFTDAACRLALKRFRERHPELPPPPAGKRGRPRS